MVRNHDLRLQSPVLYKHIHARRVNLDEHFAAPENFTSLYGIKLLAPIDILRKISRILITKLQSLLCSYSSWYDP